MIKALALTGPTASGKTALSISLARELGCEIISLDSMQIYKGMNIGTAKATAEERAAAVHHLIDFLSPTEDYSAEAYRTAAMAAARDISERGRLPLFVGGTGLYLDTLLRAPVPEVPPSDPARRAAALEKIKSEDDVRALWEHLYEIDPQSAEATHMNNVKRVLRAIEIYDATGKPKSYFDRLSKETPPDIEAPVITLDFHSRELLYSRTDRRVDEMMREGLLTEVTELLNEGLLVEGTTAAQAIGYKELIEYIRGEVTLDEAVEKIKLSTRRYAKRQLTWFRHTGAHRLFVDGENGKIKDFNTLSGELISLARELLAN
ncbi:MAG: tRNA (adenosine(37)-N6)-dimethylallyltransferase MiaA [Clostridia bacterium]|nr:tRNA (adenosine(37)-N6)-dimethylallyltransferase MiaA [Clostridia bacterium]